MHPKSIRLWPASVGLMLYQLVLALFVTGGKLDHLVYWDATWYRDIAQLGYRAELPLVYHPEGGSNLAFFPAFPLWARAVLNVLPVSPNFAVLIASWTACVAMWAYLVLVLKQLGLRASWSWLAILAFLVQPGSFYSVTGYSEPLFTAALLGYVYWSTRAMDESGPRRAGFVALAVLHGGVLTSTRILGVALAAYPLLLAVARPFPKLPRLREVVLPVTIGAASLSGFAAFLVYCSLRWGQWNMYWEANRVGWNVYFDPWKLLRPSYYMDVFFTGNLSEVLGRILTVLTLIATIALAKAFWKRRERHPMLLALAALNLGLIVQTAVGSHGMHSMVRYLIPIHALLIPLASAWAQTRFDQEKAQGWPSLGLRISAALVAFWLLAVQVMFVIRYSRNEWVS